MPPCILVSLVVKWKGLGCQLQGTPGEPNEVAILVLIKSFIPMSDENH